MKSILVSMSFWLTIACFSSSSFAGDVIKVAMNPEFVPFQGQIDGKPAGIDIDILTEIAKKMNLKVEFISAPWARCMSMVQDGEADMMGYIAFRDDRTAFMEYLKPAYQGDIKVFYVRKGEKGNLKKFEDLYNLKVGMIRGTKHFEAFDKDSKIQKNEVNKIEQAILMLDTKRLDAVIGNDSELPIHVKKLGYLDKIEIADYAIKLDKNGFFVLSKKSKLLARKAEFEKHLKEMLDSGEIDKIIKNNIKKFSF